VLARPVPPEEAALDVSSDKRHILVMQVDTYKDIMAAENSSKVRTHRL